MLQPTAEPSRPGGAGVGTSTTEGSRQAPVLSAAARISVVGFIASSTILWLYLISALYIERQMFSGVVLVPPLLTFGAIILYYFVGARAWLESKENRRTKKRLLIGFGIPFGLAVLGSCLFVLATYHVCRPIVGLCRRILRHTIGEAPAGMWRLRYQVVVTGLLILAVFPAMNAMTMANGMFRESMPGQKLVLMHNPLFGINAAGFRGPLVPKERNPDAFKPRFMFLGDSTTFGFPYPYDRVYPFLVQRRLAERGVEAETINGGIPGVSLVEIAKRLDGYMEYHPDVLFLMIGYHEPKTLDHFKNIEFADDAFLSDHSFRLKFLPPILPDVMAIGVMSQFFFASTLFSHKDPFKETKARVAFELVLESFIRRVEQKKVRLAFIDYLSGDVLPEFRSAIHDAAATNSVPVLTLGGPPIEYALNDKVHPDRAAHARIADMLVDAIIDRDWATPPAMATH